MHFIIRHKNVPPPEMQTEAVSDVNQDQQQRENSYEQLKVNTQQCDPTYQQLRI